MVFYTISKLIFLILFIKRNDLCTVGIFYCYFLFIILDLFDHNYVYHNFMIPRRISLAKAMDKSSKKSNEIDMATRGSIQTLKEEGYSVRDISERLDIPKSTIHGILQRFKEHQSHQTLPRSGRPRCTTTHVDKKMVEIMMESEEPNAALITKQLKDMEIADVSECTVRRRIETQTSFR